MPDDSGYLSFDWTPQGLLSIWAVFGLYEKKIVRGHNHDIHKFITIVRPNRIEEYLIAFKYAVKEFYDIQFGKYTRILPFKC